MLLWLPIHPMRNNMLQANIPLPITKLLREWRAGDDQALAQLTPVVYDELQRLAMGFMRRERPGHTLTTGDLVHEAFLKMVDERERNFENRLHFFALASKIMKDFLIQYARANHAKKRGGEYLRVTLGPEEALPESRAADRIEFLAEAIENLSRRHQRTGRILEMFYYVGLGVEDIARVLGIGSATVKRDLRFARAWIKKCYGEGSA